MHSPVALLQVLPTEQSALLMHAPAHWPVAARHADAPQFSAGFDRQSGTHTESTPRNWQMYPALQSRTVRHDSTQNCVVPPAETHTPLTPQSAFVAHPKYRQ